jgi:CPA2 family monovalent cation:H+ antiporter-2
VTPGIEISHHELELLADVGVLLLLFESGMEVDFSRLRGSGLLLVAPLQVLVTTGLVAAAAFALGLSATGAILLGASIALSSGAVVAHVVNSRRRTTNAATDRAMADWSSIQDLTGVVLTAAALLATGVEGEPGLPTAGRLALYGLLAVAVAWLLPRVLRAFRSDGDLMLLLSVGGSFTLAGLGSAVFRLPLPLSAFVGGAAAGNSPEVDVVREHVRPFRELFAALFFVTLPTLIVPESVRGALPWLLFVLVALAVAKVAVTALLARGARLPGVRPVQLALGLGQMGEFSFAIAVIDHTSGLLPEPVYEAVLIALVASVGASVLLARLGGSRTRDPER